MDDPANSVQQLGIRLDRYSHWPVAWHPIVMRVLHEAVRLGVPSLYVKEKLGGLRIQGGGESLAEVVAQAMREADRTCVVCGGQCDKHNVPNPPLCSSCGVEGWQSSIRWVEPRTES
jgi:hypothetical protein